MVWVAEITEFTTRKTQLLLFKNEKELGIFLQNYDGDKYSIDNIAGSYSEEIAESYDQFIKKDENLETGGGN